MRSKGAAVKDVRHCHVGWISRRHEVSPIIVTGGAEVNVRSLVPRHYTGGAERRLLSVCLNHRLLCSGIGAPGSKALDFQCSQHARVQGQLPLASGLDRDTDRD